MKCSSFFPKICVALLFLFRYVIYQEWLFCLVWGKDHDSFFPIWKFNTLYRKAHPAPLHFIVTFIVFWVTIYAWAYFWILFCPSSLLAYPCANTILSELFQISTGLNTGSVSPLDFFWNFPPKWKTRWDYPLSSLLPNIVLAILGHIVMPVGEA